MEMSPQDVYDTLLECRVNVDLVPSYSDELGFLWTCRLREYGNTMNKDQMILAAGRDADEALMFACIGWLQAAYMRLDWRARASEPGVCSETNKGISSRFDPSEARKALGARFGVEQYVPSNDRTFELPEPIQKLRPLPSKNGGKPTK